MSKRTDQRIRESTPLACEEAWAKIFARAKSLGQVRAALDDAAGLVLAGAVRAPIAVPPFDNSAMDGFVVRAADIRGASPSAPRRLRVAALIAAGDHWPGPLRAGQAAQIMTGAAVPRGADTVVRQEDTRAGEGWVEILAEKPRGEAIRRRGEDVARGRIALAKGTRLGPAELSITASLGLPRVAVHRRPRVAVFSSGSELKRPGTRLRPGEIYESSRWALCETLRGVGADVRFLGVARDDRAETRRMIREGLKFDVLVTAGGVSVGEFDFVRDELKLAGAREVFWRVAQRPGKPLLFATCRRGKSQRLIFGLPGNPVSSLVSLHVFVLPALRKMMGLREHFPPLLRFRLAEPIKKPAALRTFHRVSFINRDGHVAVTATGPSQSSGVFSSMLNAHALTNLPPGPSVIEEGEEIECFVLDTEALVRARALTG
jgi:molybdopterin molybdotransferase